MTRMEMDGNLKDWAIFVKLHVSAMCFGKFTKLWIWFIFSCKIHLISSSMSCISILFMTKVVNFNLGQFWSPKNKKTHDIHVAPPLNFHPTRCLFHLRLLWLTLACWSLPHHTNHKWCTLATLCWCRECSYRESVHTGLSRKHKCCQF